MVEVLPIKLLTDEDSPIFGLLNVSLGKLSRNNLPVGAGIAVSPPKLKIKTTLEHYQFANKEVFEQTLVLIKKEINSIPIPASLISEVGKHQHFFFNNQSIKSVKNLWLALLDFWLNQIKTNLWHNGFYTGITDNLSPVVATFTKKLSAYGRAFYDGLQDDVIINTSWGNLDPKQLKQVADLVNLANKKLFIPHEYEWILEDCIKLVQILPHTPINTLVSNSVKTSIVLEPQTGKVKQFKSAMKVLLDLSEGLTIEKDVDGIYISSEKIFNLEKPKESFENMVFKLVESSLSFPNQPVLFKLADLSEGMGKIRGSLRLLHQQSLFNPLIEALNFARHKKGLTNIHIVIPFIRTIGELVQVKRELAAKKLIRKNSLKIWMEIAVPENIINLEDYLQAEVDGVVLNINELISHLNGFDHLQEDLLFYRNEVSGLLKFLETGIKIMHKAKIPIIAYGSLCLYPQVMEYLIEKGILGIVVERYEAHSAHELLYQMEKRVILKRS